MINQNSSFIQKLAENSMIEVVLIVFSLTKPKHATKEKFFYNALLKLGTWF